MICLLVYAEVVDRSVINRVINSSGYWPASDVQPLEKKNSFFQCPPVNPVLKLPEAMGPFYPYSLYHS